jgi:hypothetical protein
VHEVQVRVGDGRRVLDLGSEATSKWRMPAPYSAPRKGELFAL